MSRSKTDRAKRVERRGLILCFSLRLNRSEWRPSGGSGLERSILLNSERILVHQFTSTYFPLKEVQRQPQACLFSLQLALTSNFIPPFHCGALLATLGITKASLEWQQSGRSEVNTR